MEAELLAKVLFSAYQRGNADGQPVYGVEIQTMVERLSETILASGMDDDLALETVEVLESMRDDFPRIHPWKECGLCGHPYGNHSPLSCEYESPSHVKGTCSCTGFLE